MSFFLFKTISLPIPKGIKTNLFEALKAVGLQVKNIKNQTVFVINNVITSYEQNVLKDDLHDNQLLILSNADLMSQAINGRRITKSETILSDFIASNPGEIKEEDLPKPAALIREFTEDRTAWQILNNTLLENIVHGTESPKENSLNAYSSIPAKIAQSVIKNILSDYSSYFASLKSYNLNSTNFTGRPQRPSKYLAQNELSTFEISLQKIDETRHFPKLTKEIIYTDYAMTKPLSDEAKEAWNQLDIMAGIEKIKERTAHCNVLSKEAIPVTIRVSFPNDKPCIEVVFRWETEIKSDSYMGKLLNRAGVKEYSGKETVNTALLNAINGMTKEECGVVLGIDMGVRNFYTMGCTNGSMNYSLSNTAIYTKLKKKDEKLNKIKCQLHSDELKAIQCKKNKKEELTAAEKDKERKEHAKIYSDPRFKKAQKERNNYQKNTLHHISNRILKEAVKNGCHLIVIGLNKGWKQRSNMGKKRNFAFYNAAHSRLIAMLRQKGIELGIVVVTTEESYTSKPSFQNKALLHIYEKKTAAIKNTNTSSLPPYTGQQQGHEYLGKRDGRYFKNDRNVEGEKIIGWSPVVNADVNGEHNILRKVLPWYGFTKETNFAYIVEWLSPRYGIIPMKRRI